jgi:NADH:ubiquinone oxidoreductase subunit
MSPHPHGRPALQAAPPSPRDRPLYTVHSQSQFKAPAPAKPARTHTLYAPGRLNRESAAAKLRQSGHPKLAAELENCGALGVWKVCRNCGHCTVQTNTCKRHHCPECSAARATQRASSMCAAARRAARATHIVLTLRNTTKLTRQAYTQLWKAFARLRRASACRAWRGGAATAETTNDGNGWHLHIHAIVDCPPINTASLSATWFKATKGTGTIVKALPLTTSEHRQAASRYVCKPPRLAAWSGEQLAEFAAATAGARTATSFGNWRGPQAAAKPWPKPPRQRCAACGSHQLYWTVRPHGLTLARPP